MLAVAADVMLVGLADRELASHFADFSFQILQLGKSIKRTCVFKMNIDAFCVIIFNNIYIIYDSLARQEFLLKFTTVPRLNENKCTVKCINASIFSSMQLDKYSSF